MIKKSPHGGYDLYNKAGTKKLAHHDTKESAEKQERAIEAAKHRGMSLKGTY